MGANPPPWAIEYYNRRVQAWADALPSGIQADLLHLLRRMRQYGPVLGMPYIRPMGGGLCEVRAKGAEGIARAFFCAVVGRRIVILHGFIKKTGQTPRHELELARKRLKEVKP
jgi:phage-related protein